MPTYGYRCQVCGHQFERFQKMTDPALTECESCGGAVKKMLYPVGIQFKGSGFYVNDSRPPTGNSDAPIPDAKEKKTDAKADVKTETKSDAPATAPSPSSTDSKPASTTPTS